MDEELFLEAVKAIVLYEEDWIPTYPGTALYIRPYIISDEISFSVEPSKHYHFYIILTPVGAYYDINRGGLTGSHIYVEDEYVRAAVGGTGFVKCGGNYAGAMRANVKAAKYNCDDVLWLDAKEKKYVEEVGTSNAFFMINGEVITAPLNGTILPGITRDSVIQILKKKGMKITERRISIDEIVEAYKKGQFEEMFASGTAAVISPVGELRYKGDNMVINGGGIGPVAQELYDTIYGIQTGKVADEMGWTVEVK